MEKVKNMFKMKLTDYVVEFLQKKGSGISLDIREP